MTDLSVKDEIIALELDDENETEQPDRTILAMDLSDEAEDEDLLFELFVHAGPLETVTLRNGVAEIVYKYVESVEYALDIYSGLLLFNRPLVLTTLNHRIARKMGHNRSNPFSPSNHSDNYRQRSNSPYQGSDMRHTRPGYNRHDSPHSSYGPPPPPQYHSPEQYYHHQQPYNSCPPPAPYYGHGYGPPPRTPPRQQYGSPPYYPPNSYPPRDRDDYHDRSRRQQYDRSHSYR